MLSTTNAASPTANVPMIRVRRIIRPKGWYVRQSAEARPAIDATPSATRARSADDRGVAGRWSFGFGRDDNHYGRCRVFSCDLDATCIRRRCPDHAE